MTEIATAPLVLRSHLEDQSRSEEFVRSTHDLTVMLKGARYAHTHESIIHFVSGVVFNTAMVAGGWWSTTAAGGGGGNPPLYLQGSSSPIARSRTLGEEFCDIMPAQLQVSNASPVMTEQEEEPSIIRQGLVPPKRRVRAPKFTSLGAVGAIPVTRRHQMVYCALLSFQSMLMFAGLKQIVPTERINGIITGVLRLHRTIFYLFGTYASLAAQMTSYRYLCITPRLQQAYAKENVYLVAGVLRAVVDVANLVKGVYGLHKAYQRHARERTRQVITGGRLQRGPRGGGAEEEENGGVDTENSSQTGQCMLCLDARKVPTAAACGHIFCWGCIRDWLHSELSCPLCRQECKHAHLVPLIGYTSPATPSS